MKKIKVVTVLLMLIIVVSGCSKNDIYKEKLIKVYPKKEESINNISNNDAKKMYEIYEDNKKYSYNDLCYNYVLYNDDTPQEVKKIIYEFDDYDFSSFEVYRSARNSNDLAFKTDVITKNFSRKYKLEVSYNANKTKGVTFEADIKNNSSDENYYILFYLDSMQLMGVVDDYFTDNMDEAADILDEASDGKAEYNGIVYRWDESNEKTIFTIEP